jgi:ATP-dependent DNA helicase RecG
MNSKLPLNLDDLLRQRTVEGEHIEYKAGWNSDPIIRTLCAFANDFENLGGYVILEQDCDESGRPIFPRRAFRRSSGQNPAGAARLLQPDPAPLFPDPERRGVRRQEADRPAPGGQNRPYKAPQAVSAKHKTHHYYIRRYASTIEARGEAERECSAWRPQSAPSARR